MNSTVLVLGAGGRFGRAASVAFARAGWMVIGQTRGRPGDSGGNGTRLVQAAPDDTGRLAAEARGAVVVVNAMNPLYTRWNEEALPLQSAAVAVARRLGATLMLPGNVYNFGRPVPAVIDESAPQRPTGSKAAIRIRMEAAMRVDGLRSIVVRAGDFFGGTGAGTWMDQAILKDLARGRIVYPGPLDRVHAWAYLPDLAEAFVRVATVRDRLPSHAALPFPGHCLTGAELVAGIAAAARRSGVPPDGRALRVAGLPWTLIRLAGLFNPMLRELARMSYLWREPHRLDGAALERLIGPVPHTPLDQALDETLRHAAGLRAAGPGAGPDRASGRSGYRAPHSGRVAPGPADGRGLLSDSRSGSG